MRKWHGSEGAKHLERIGVEKGHTVVDFGCRVGHYSIPAGRLVGPEGRVYAIDRNRDALRALEKKAAGLGVTSVSPMHNDGGVKIDLPAAAADVVLLYDILHMMDKPVRTELYEEVLRVLKPGALLSVYPTHTKIFLPNGHFAAMTIDDVQHEIMEAGFLYKAAVWCCLSHDNGLVDSCVLSFRKRHEAES